MKKYFLAYNFATAKQSGFGDISLEGDGVHSMDDIKQAKEHIKAWLISKGHVDPVVVVINWREFDPVGAERKA